MFHVFWVWPQVIEEFPNVTSSERGVGGVPGLEIFLNTPNIFPNSHFPDWPSYQLMLRNDTAPLLFLKNDELCTGVIKWGHKIHRTETPYRYSHPFVNARKSCPFILRNFDVHSHSFSKRHAISWPPNPNFLRSSVEITGRQIVFQRGKINNPSKTFYFDFSTRLSSPFPNIPPRTRSRERLLS